MRKRIVIGALLVLGFAAPARAELGFFRWWDSLSGPGPFSGVVFDPIFYCHDTNDRGERSFTFDWNCHSGDRRQLRIGFGVEIARVTGPNNLPYASGSAPGVTAYPVLFTVTIARNRFVDYGAGLGFVRFTGSGFGFSRLALEQRVTVKPFAGIGQNERTKRRNEFLQLRLFATEIPGTIKASDFGAVGDWSSSGEFLPGFMVILELSNLLRR